MFAQDREDQYYWVLREMQKVWPGLPHVNMWDYSRWVAFLQSWDCSDLFSSAFLPRRHTILCAAAAAAACALVHLLYRLTSILSLGCIDRLQAGSTVLLALLALSASVALHHNSPSNPPSWS